MKAVGLFGVLVFLSGVAGDVWDWILRIDQQLSFLWQQWGVGLYALTIGIVFIETGVVIFPFLPGDSLLFAVGLLGAMDPSVKLFYWSVGLILAAFLGDQVNFTVGQWGGQWALRRGWVSKDRWQQTRDFFERWGWWAIVVGRFVPVIRTLAPFFAGTVGLSRWRFVKWNAISALIWVGSLVSLGYAVGNIPFLRPYGHRLIYGIILISLWPLVKNLIRQRHGSLSRPGEPDKTKTILKSRAVAPTVERRTPNP